MSQDAEHITWLVSKWQEITGITIAILGILGITIKRRSGKMIVTRDYFDTRLELFSERMQNDIHDFLGNVYDHVDEKVNRVDKRVDELMIRKK